MSETPEAIGGNNPNIVDEGLSFMKSPDANPVPFDEVEAMLQDVESEGRLFEVMSHVLNDAEIKDTRKLMMVQIIGFSFSSRFTIEQYNALTVLLGLFSRKIAIPPSTAGEKVVSLWDSRVIAHRVRTLASDITKEPSRKIKEGDAVRVLALPPFNIREPMLTNILNEVYPNRGI